MSKSRIKLSQALPVLALAAAAVAPMPQALGSLSASPAALAAGNPCAPSNPCAPMGAKGKAKAGNPCAPKSGKAGGMSGGKAGNPCAPSK